jgi:transcriptional regulator with XRE-family HTH domain
MQSNITQTPFGVRIEVVRVGRGIGLRALARAIDVSPAYLSQIETGRCSPPAIPIIQKLAHELGSEFFSLVELADRWGDYVSTQMGKDPEFRQAVVDLVVKMRKPC